MRAKKTPTDVRQEQIAEAALSLIAEEGIDSLNMAKIGDRVGIVPSALYRHFKSKEDVLDEVFQLIGKKLLTNVAAAEKAHDDCIERLHFLILRHAEMIAANRAIPHVVFSNSLHAGHSERKAMVNKIITGYIEKIEEIIRQGRKNNKIRQDADPKTLSVLFLGIILPAVVLWDVSEGKYDLENHVKNAWPVFKRAILPDGQVAV